MGFVPFFLGALLPLVHLQEQYQLTIRSYIMNKIEAIEKLRNTIRRKHFSLSTERTYIGWLVRFMRYLADGHGQGLSTEAKVEAFLTQLAHQGVSSSTQNQAFNPLLFFYKDY
jgi:site-specific recombinase XerD